MHNRAGPTRLARPFRVVLGRVRQTHDVPHTQKRGVRNVTSLPAVKLPSPPPVLPSRPSPTGPCAAGIAVYEVYLSLSTGVCVVPKNQKEMSRMSSIDDQFDDLTDAEFNEFVEKFVQMWDTNMKERCNV